MKIRVTLVFLLSTSIAADNRNAIEVQRMSSSNRKFPERKDWAKRFAPVHRVYEYSRSMEAVGVDVMKNKNGQAEITKPVYYSEAVAGDDLSHGSSGSLGVESGKTLQQLVTMRINSKQPSEIYRGGFLPVKSKVLSRKKKDKMEQAMLALLMAYKMKFTALIPIMLGGLSLLVSTTALAGFFFALFAAVLGLKAH